VKEAPHGVEGKLCKVLDGVSTEGVKVLYRLGSLTAVLLRRGGNIQRSSLQWKI